MEPTPRILLGVVYDLLETLPGGFRLHGEDAGKVGVEAEGLQVADRIIGNRLRIESRIVNRPCRDAIEDCVAILFALGNKIGANGRSRARLIDSDYGRLQDLGQLFHKHSCGDIPAVSGRRRNDELDRMAGE
jgi:hypothetical protein